MKNWLARSFRNQILLFMVSVVSVLSIALLVCFSYVSADLIEQQTKKRMETGLETATHQADALLENAHLQLLRFVADDALLDGMKLNTDTYTYDFYLASQQMREHISDMQFNNASIASTYVYSMRNGLFFCTDQPRTLYYKDIYDSAWYDGFRVEFSDDWRFYADDLTPSVPYTLEKSVVVKNPYDGQILGVVSVNILAKTLGQTLTVASVLPQSQYFIANEQGRILYHVDASKIGTLLDDDATAMLAQGANSLITDSRFIVCTPSTQVQGWTYFTDCDYETVMAPLNAVRYATVVLIAMAIFLSVVVSLGLSNYILRPITLLRTYMQTAQTQNYKARIPSTRADEVGDLFRSYNAMMTKTDQLINDNYSQKLLITQLQVKNLQAQISPHFLYNALDAIHWAARDGMIDEACDMIYYLADHFRKGLTDGREILPVRECAEILESYLALQRALNENTIEVSVYVNPLVANMPVLKYLFQPIVENAFKHGLSAKEGDRSISIRFSALSNGKMRFSVQDNGVGMSAEKLQSLRQSLLQANSIDLQEHLALKNISLQLQTLYDGARLHIVSTQDKGTTVYFDIEP